MKILVLGCNGMAGHTITLYLQEQGYEVEGLARSKSKIIDNIVSDVRNLDFVKSIIREGNYYAVINCIGILNQNAEKDHESAAFLNAYFPHYLANITDETNTQIIHISTDCVFSGKEGKYTEDSIPNGTSFYDRSKALGEINDEKNLTLRSSIIGPDLNKNGIGLLNWFLQQQGQVKGFTRAIWTGQTTLQLAKTIEYALHHQISGLYNMVPNKSICKYDLLCLFNKYLRQKSLEIIPDDKLIIDKSLVRTNFCDFDYTVPDYENQIRELGDWMHMHKELYPHYANA